MPKTSKSPLQDYLDKYDNAHINENYNQYWVTAVNQDYRVWNALFVDEISWRESHRRNLVFSIDGIQGEGKSAGLLRALEVIAERFYTKFNLKKLFFFQEDLKESLDNAKKRTQHGLDEQPRMFGLMSGMIQEQLANYEDIYRKPQISIGYASPTLRVHEHFFIFQAMGNIELNDKTGFPETVELMLKTRRKSDNIIMPRGILRFKWPDYDTWARYEARKDKFISQMQENKGGVMNKMEKDANKVIKEAGNAIYREVKGQQKPGTNAQIDLAMYEIIGMRAYTVDGYKLLREKIKQKL